jgi:hypothetical protein
MNYTWVVTSSAFPGIMFYLRLLQDSTGAVAGQIIDISDTFLGSAASGRIDAQGRLLALRLRFNSGADVTISGQMQRDGFQVVGNFSNTTSRFNGVPLNGLPVTLEID